jgi:hypothetical protein
MSNFMYLIGFFLHLLFFSEDFFLPDRKCCGQGSVVAEQLAALDGDSWRKRRGGESKRLSRAQHSIANEYKANNFAGKNEWPCMYVHYSPNCINFGGVVVGHEPTSRDCGNASSRDSGGGGGEATGHVIDPARHEALGANHDGESMGE